MGRTASPATPGTDPVAKPQAASTAPAADDTLAQDALQAGALAAAATAETQEQKDANAVLHAELAKRDTQIAEMQAMIKSLARSQLAQAMPEKVELPDLGTVMKQNPTIAVLTSGGWYVPPVHPTDRAAKG